MRRDLGGVQKYWYDANGNMTTRTAGSTYTFAYDSENRLTGVSGGASAAFTYDADGNRVKSDFSGTVTYYVGNWYEKTGAAETKYYYFGGKRVAMRTSSGVTYIHGDQLGSATNTTGVDVKTQRYYPWGTKRSTTQVTTPYRFTGQREEATIGLYFYNARWYDAALGRFAQPDTIVPEPGNPQALNRYSYVLNDPVKYTDPSGKFPRDKIMEYFGAQTWDEVLDHFRPGGDLEGLWGWLEVLRSARFGDQIIRFAEWQEFPKPHPVGYSALYYVFAEYEGGIGLAWDKPGYRDHPFDANGWARASQAAGYLLGGRPILKNQPYRFRVYYDASNVDWNDVIGDIVGMGMGVLSWAVKVPSLAERFDVGSKLVGTAMGVKHARQVAYGDRSAVSLFLDAAVMLPWPAVALPAGAMSLATDLGAGISVEAY